VVLMEYIFHFDGNRLHPRPSFCPIRRGQGAEE